MWNKHQILEKHGWLLSIAILVVVAIGGIVEIAPLFYLKNTIEKVEGMRPYTPLELAGREIYIREGCYVCHSQMVRPLRDEVERYGHYSLAAESMYDHPFQWGSKRTGPDLARLGGKYSDEWHVQHMTDPRSVVPESVMPPYAFLDRPLRLEPIKAYMTANALIGVPYSQEMRDNYKADIIAQANPDEGDVSAFLSRYPGADARVFDGNTREITEMDAIIAFMQMLGTLVNFEVYEGEAEEHLR